MNSRKISNPTNDKNYDDLNSCYIHKNITVEEFINRIKDNPFCVFDDFDVKYAIEILSKKAKGGVHNEAVLAKKILGEVGLNAFKPMKQTGRRRKDSMILQIEKNPVRFVKIINNLKSLIQPIWNSLYIKSKKPLNVVIQEVVKSLENPDTANLIPFPLPKSLSGTISIKVIEKEIQSSAKPEVLALAIYAEKWDLDYHTLYSLYYRNDKVKKVKKEINSPNYREPLIKEIKKKYSDGIHFRQSDEYIKINLFDLQHNNTKAKNDSLFVYNEAYEWYKVVLETRSLGFRFLYNPKT